MDNGWNNSTDAWIRDMGEEGDYSRRAVLDAPMMDRVASAVAGGARAALDVGCGEGRFCRMMARAGLAVTGIDPTVPMLATARARDSDGCYIDAAAESLPFPDRSFDLVVSYLSLIDIDDHEAAYAEMLRVLRPGGLLLIANLSSFATAIPDGDIDGGWLRDPMGGMSRFGCDRYHESRAYWIGWRGIRVRNWHRPLAAYMAPLLRAGAQLRHFAEPAPAADKTPDGLEDPFGGAPMFVLMEWQKPAD